MSKTGEWPKRDQHVLDLFAHSSKVYLLRGQIFGHGWSRMVTYLFWPRFGHILVTFGHVWSRLVTFGHETLVFLATFGHGRILATFWPWLVTVNKIVFSAQYLLATFGHVWPRRVLHTCIHVFKQTQASTRSFA